MMANFLSFLVPSFPVFHLLYPRDHAINRCLSYSTVFSIHSPHSGNPPTPSIAPRAQHCANAPLTVAGTYAKPPQLQSPNNQLTTPHPPPSHLTPKSLDPPTLPPNNPHSPIITPRKSTSTILWCAPSSSTYVIISKAATGIPATAIANVLSASFEYIQIRMNKHGDGPVVGGGFDWNSVSGAELHTWNSNNHQQTYGVLRAAIAALMDYMGRNGWGGVT